MAHAEDDDALPGQDSFIDVVCNMVGILIVLVMIVGVRASGAGQAPSDPALQTPAKTIAAKPPQQKEKPADVNNVGREVAEATHEINRAVGQLADLATQAALIEARRDQLSVVREEVELDIQRRRSQLDSAGQRQFDVQREIADTEIKLHKLSQEQMSLLAAPTKTEQIECVPTPIGKEVGPDAIYVRLRRGRLAVIPVNELQEERVRQGGDFVRNSLNSKNRAEETYGPINGFRMRFFIARSDGKTPLMNRQGEQFETYVRFIFLPVSEDVGVPVEQALLPDSEFMTALRAARKSAPSVCAWVYGDSFDEQRTLKRAMWEAGVPLAVRPLPDHAPVGFASDGTAAVAQ